MTQSELGEEIQISLTKAEAAAILEFFWSEWIPTKTRKEIVAVLGKLEEGLRRAFWVKQKDE